MLKDKAMQKIIRSFGSVLLTLAFLTAATLAWFALEDAGIKNLNMSVGHVSYTMPSAGNMFYNAFELENEYYDDDFDDEGVYIPATEITEISAGGVPLVLNNGAYVFALEETSKTRLTAAFEPENATDRLSFQSSDDTIISVNTYGTIYAVGSVGQSAIITVTAIDRDESEGRRAENIVAQVRVTVIENTGENQYGFLPGGVNILRNDLVLKNKSTVDTKVRLRVDWEYSDYEEDETNEYLKYPISELFPEGTTPANISVSGAVAAPLSLTTDEMWQFVPAEGMFSIADANGIAWSIDTVSLRQEDYENLQTAITNNTPFVFSEKMIDKAHIYICYSTAEITSADSDYGDTVPANTNPAGTDYIAVTHLLTNESYAGFSTRKVLSVTLVTEARQAGFYDETEWYEVFCTKEDGGLTNHSPTV